MFKRTLLNVVLIAVVVCAFAQVSFAGEYNAKHPFPYETVRSWVYFDFNAIFSPEWSLHVMPGHSYEYKKWNEDGEKDRTKPAQKYFFGELFVGPWYTMKLDKDLTLKVGLEYYLMQFDVDGDNARAENRKFYNHCIELIPIITYNITDQLFVRNRIIFHNIINSTMVDNKTMNNGQDNSEWGYSMTIREMLVLGYKINPMFTLLIQDEIFIAAKQADNATYKTGGRSFDYATGFYQNRFYLGGSIALSPEASITAYYLLRHDFAMNDSPVGGASKGSVYKKGDVAQVNHCAFLIFTYNLKI